MLTNSRITILTKESKGRENIYIPQQIVEAHWEDTRGYNIQQSSRALSEVDNITVYISIQEYKIKINDLIVRGEVTKEYGSYESLKKEHEDAFIITSVDKYDYGNLRHIRLGAK